MQRGGVDQRIKFRIVDRDEILRGAKFRDDDVATRNRDAAGEHRAALRAANLQATGVRRHLKRRNVRSIEDAQVVGLNREIKGWIVERCESDAPAEYGVAAARTSAADGETRQRQVVATESQLTVHADELHTERRDKTCAVGHCHRAVHARFADGALELQLTAERAAGVGNRR